MKCIILGLSLLFWITHGMTQECQTPLFLKQMETNPNILIIFDNSGSMNEVIEATDPEIWDPPYDPDETYNGWFSSGATYGVSRSGWYGFYRWINHPKRKYIYVYLISSYGGQWGRYSGNYLNWIQNYAPVEKNPESKRYEVSPPIPTSTRLSVAKDVVIDIVNAEYEVEPRWGLMKFRHDDGGILVKKCGSSKTAITSMVSGIVGTTWTPLAESLHDAGLYFKGENPLHNSPIEVWCQQNFVILITDGYSTMDLDIPPYIGDYDNDGRDPGNCASIGAPFYPNWYDCSDYLDDVALYYYVNDLREDLPNRQNLVTYTVGFFVDAPLLKEAAAHGNGQYFTCWDAEELKASLSEIVEDIVMRVISGGSVAVALCSGEVKEEDVLVTCQFHPTGWRGTLRAYTLPIDEGEEPIWDAGEILSTQSPSERNIFTYIGGEKVAFRSLNKDKLMDPLGAASLDEAEKIIDWVRGEAIEGYRTRIDNWKMGDVVHSTPVVTGPPKGFYSDSSYREFKALYKNRRKIVYVGANDGMLHAFRLEDGVEEWAFIPENLLPRLKELTDPEYDNCHRYFVDLSPRTFDCKIGGQWKTLLFGGEREGGWDYFVLDVTKTDYTDVEVVTEFQDPYLGSSFSSAKVGKVKMENEEERWIAFLSSGLENIDGRGYVAFFDIETCTIEKRISLKEGSVHAPSLVTPPAIVDLDTDGVVDRLYVGDIGGNLWKVDLTEGYGEWRSVLLFQAKKDGIKQPIMAPPATCPTGDNKIMIYFGTGRYLDEADINDTNPQTFYGLLDLSDGVRIYREDLLDQTVEPFEHTLGGRKGWFIDLYNGAGERTIKTCVVYGGAVFFTSFIPNMAPCEAGGKGFLYAVCYKTGAPMNEPILDVNGDKKVDEGDLVFGEVPRSIELGGGLPSEPVLDTKNFTIFVQSSDQGEITQTAFAPPEGRLEMRTWREF